MQKENIDVTVNLAGAKDTRTMLRKLNQLISIGEFVMTQISDFVNEQKGYISKISDSLGGIKNDLEDLNKKITELQDKLNSSGNLSQEESDSLNELQASTKDLADKVKALDDLNPPKAPDGLESPSNGNEEHPQDGEQPKDSENGEKAPEDEKKIDNSSQPDGNSPQK